MVLLFIKVCLGSTCIFLTLHTPFFSRTFGCLGTVQRRWWWRFLDRRGWRRDRLLCIRGRSQWKYRTYFFLRWGRRHEWRFGWFFFSGGRRGFALHEYHEKTYHTCNQDNQIHDQSHTHERWNAQHACEIGDNASDCFGHNVGQGQACERVPSVLFRCTREIDRPTLGD